MDIPLGDNKGVLIKKMYDEQAFSRDAIARFPGLPLVEDHGLLHVQMSTLATAVREALEQGDQDLPGRIFEFLAEALGNPEATLEIENAIALSFVTVDELRSTPAGGRALRDMPKVIRDILLYEEQAPVEADRRSG